MIYGGKMISILLSCYKSNFDFLKEQIDSIINQTEKDWELLIYNDGTDRLSDFLIENYKDKRIKYCSDGHKGCVGAFNFLFKKAKGEYIAICDHDDIWEDDKLEVEKAYLDSHPEVDCVFGWLRWFGEKEKTEAFHISDKAISVALNFYQPIKNPTAMFRKNKFGLNDCPFDKASDFWYWAKYKDRYYHLIEWVMVNYRRHAGELTKDKTAFRENSAKIIQKNLKEELGCELSLDICRKLDRYSKEYDEDALAYTMGLLAIKKQKEEE